MIEASIPQFYLNEWLRFGRRVASFARFLFVWGADSVCSASGKHPWLRQKEFVPEAIPTGKSGSRSTPMAAYYWQRAIGCVLLAACHRGQQQPSCIRSGRLRRTLRWRLRAQLMAQLIPQRRNAAKKYLTQRLRIRRSGARLNAFDSR